MITIFRSFTFYQLMTGNVLDFFTESKSASSTFIIEISVSINIDVTIVIIIRGGSRIFLTKGCTTRNDFNFVSCFFVLFCCCCCCFFLHNSTYFRKLPIVSGGEGVRTPCTPPLGPPLIISGLVNTSDNLIFFYLQLDRHHHHQQYRHHRNDYYTKLFTVTVAI